MHLNRILPMFLDPTEYQRVAWFAYGHIEREHILNQRSMAAFVESSHPYAQWWRLLVASALAAPLLQAAAGAAMHRFMRLHGLEAACRPRVGCRGRMQESRACLG